MWFLPVTGSSTSSPGGDIETATSAKTMLRYTSRMPEETIEEEFEEALWASCRECRRIGYKPTAFERMLGDYGAVKTAQRLLKTFKPSDGFTRLWELRRLDLSLVFRVISP